MAESTKQIQFQPLQTMPYHTPMVFNGALWWAYGVGLIGSMASIIQAVPFLQGHSEFVYGVL